MDLWLGTVKGRLSRDTRHLSRAEAMVQSQEAVSLREKCHFFTVFVVFSRDAVSSLAWLAWLAWHSWMH